MNSSESNPNQWREELRQMGKQYFEIQDMLRLGFLKLAPEELEMMKAKLAELNKVRAELQRLQKELQGLDDISPILKEIRRNRIERVRAQRKIRRLEKARAEEARKAALKEKKKRRPTFLGKDLAQGLKFEGGNPAKLAELELPIIEDLGALSQATQLSCEELQYLSYHRRVASLDHYTRFSLPKRKGGRRSIAAPKPKLKQAQNWILENVLKPIPLHEAAYAYREGRSIADNARFHLGAKIILRLDIKDFFPGIRFARVKGLFKAQGYNPGIASVFALICTDAMRLSARLDGKRYFVALGDRFLPQGASTSPSISNLICRKLDNRLHKLAESLGWKYTRYADDLVFSCAQEEEKLSALLGSSRKIIQEEGFELNAQKTLLMRPHHRQMVTGLQVNHAETRVSRRDLKKFRAFLHQYQRDGALAMTQKLGKDSSHYGRGYLSFLKMVNPGQAEKFTQQYPWLTENT